MKILIYYFAGLICLLEIIMLVSIVFIPLLFCLRKYTFWFDGPFDEAERWLYRNGYAKY